MCTFENRVSINLKLLQVYFSINSTCIIKNSIILLLSILLLTRVNHAQWPTTPTEDLQIAYNSAAINLAPGENGDVWVQMGGGHPDYYYQTFLQKVNPWGYSVFDTIVGVQGPEDNHAAAAMSSDGMAGLYLAYHTAEWINYPHTYNYTLRLQHYDSTGTPLWPNYGIAIARMDTVSHGSQCQVIPDESSGVIVVWTDRREPISAQNYDLFAQRYSAHGQAIWNRNIVVTTRNQNPLRVFSDQEGGVIIQGGAWFYRLDMQGNAVWDSLGVRDPVWSNKIISGPQGSVIRVTGILCDSGNYPDFKYVLITNRLNHSGEWVWPDSGVSFTDTLLITDPGGMRYELAMLDTNKILYAWQARYLDPAFHTNGIWVQIMKTNGDIVLPEGGMQFVDDTTASLEALMASEFGSVLCFFRKGPENHLFAQRIDSLGQPMWGDSAVLVSTRDRGVLGAVSDGQGGAIVATGTASLKQISVNGNLGEVITTTFPEPPAQRPKHIRLSPAYPNPFNSATIVRYEVPVSTILRVNIYNLRGQRVTTLIDKKHEPGIYHVRWNGKDDANSPVPSGVYFVRLQSSLSTISQTRKIILIR